MRNKKERKKAITGTVSVDLVDINMEEKTN